MKVNQLLLTWIASAIFSTHAQIQTFEWAKHWGGSLMDRSYSITSDGSGNLYITGDFDGTANFDPGPGTFNLTSAGQDDIFISKLDTNGNFLWAKQFGDTDNDGGLSIATDNFGNVYTTGGFQGVVDFDPGSGIQNLTATGGGFDVFISKLDATGNYVWANQFSGQNIVGFSIATDAAGNVFTTGRFTGSANFDPNGSNFTLTSAGSNDIFVAKLDATGNFQWAVQFGNSSSDYGHGIATDGNGNVYSTGHFSGIVDFDPGVNTFNLSSSATSDIFISKLDGAGNFVWAKRMGGSSSEVGRDITIDDFGNVLTSGAFQGTVDFNPGIGNFSLTSAGSFDVFISKLDSNGNFKWAKHWGGTSSDLSYSIASDTAGNVYATGDFIGTVDFDPGVDSLNMTAFGFNDVFVSKFDSAGTFMWTKQIGGTGSDNGHSITTDAAGNVYTSGYFAGTADFNSGPDSFNLTSTGTADAFIHKISLCASTSESFSITTCGSYTVPSGDETYTTSGTYLDTIFNSRGCDSVITINLTINNATSSSLAIAACDSYTVPSGNYTYTTSGTYQDTIPNLAGCDSIITINLSINNTSSALAISSCDSYTVPSGDETYTSSGTYLDTIPNALGCDSLLTINLTINSSSSSVQSITTCDSYTVPSGDETYTVSGTYLDTIPNATSCDSILTINLSINSSTSSTQSITACDSYTVPSGDQTYTTSGTYTDLIPNASGCDSILTINLTILPSSSSIQSITACESYTVPSGNQTYKVSGTYFDTISNSAGCDSVLTINLTINTVDISVINSSPILQANAINASYQWLDCNNNFAVLPDETNPTYTASANGSYAVEVIENGCTDTSACEIVANVGILENNFESNLSIYPNPTTNLLNINLGESQKEISIIVSNAIGQQVVRKSFKNSDLLQLKLPEETGIYFIEIQADNKRAILKVLKE